MSYKLKLINNGYIVCSVVKKYLHCADTGAWLQDDVLKVLVGLSL